MVLCYLCIVQYQSAYTCINILNYIETRSSKVFKLLMSNCGFFNATFSMINSKMEEQEGFWSIEISLPSSPLSRVHSKSCISQLRYTVQLWRQKYEKIQSNVFKIVQNIWVIFDYVTTELCNAQAERGSHRFAYKLT